MTVPALTVDAAALARLHAELHGHVLLPGNADYPDAARVWNAAVKATPAIIARPGSTADVARCVRFARTQRLPISVRSGGHSPAGYGTGSGMVIDLGRMKDIQIDPQRRTAVLQPGLVWREVAVALHEHGLALTSGDVGTVGVGGLTQGGGIGWFVRRHGLTIDRLTAVELVTADGDIVRASAAENPDLFWGVRGGGANLGILTALEFDVHEGGTVYGGAVFYHGRDAKQVLAGYAAHADAAPESLSTQAFLISAPPAPFIPEELVGQPIVAVIAVNSGDLQEGERILAPLRGLAQPIADLIGPMPYPAIFAIHEFVESRDFRHTVRSQFMHYLSDDFLDTLVDRTLEVLNPGTGVQLRVLGGAMSRVPRGETAFAHRDKPYLLMITNFTPDDAGDEAETHAHAATEFIYSGVQQYGAGTYGNFLSTGEEYRVSEAYPGSTHDRLAQLKAKYDPENVFQRNANVKPATHRETAELA